MDEPVTDNSLASPLLTARQHAQFHRDGFIMLPNIVPISEIARVLESVTTLFHQRAGRNEGAQRDMLGHDDDGAPAVQPEIDNPSNYAPELRHNLLTANAAAIASQLLGDKAYPNFEHAILKPANSGTATPWHQDEAYKGDSTLSYDQISIWVPLQDVDESNGCMKYVPRRTHLSRVLEHQSVGGDPLVHALECIADDFDPNQAVSLPVSAGGATVHHSRTVHAATANLSNEPRYAYVLAFRVPAEKDAERNDFLWQRTRDTARMRRRRQWRRSGGVAIEAYRRLRRQLG